MVWQIRAPPTVGVDDLLEPPLHPESRLAFLLGSHQDILAQAVEDVATVVKGDEVRIAKDRCWMEDWQQQSDCKMIR